MSAFEIINLLEMLSLMAKEDHLATRQREQHRCREIEKEAARCREGRAATKRSKAAKRSNPCCKEYREYRGCRDKEYREYSEIVMHRDREYKEYNGRFYMRW